MKWNKNEAPIKITCGVIWKINNIELLSIFRYERTLYRESCYFQEIYVELFRSEIQHLKRVRRDKQRSSTEVKYSLHYLFCFSLGLTLLKIKVEERCSFPAESVYSKLYFFFLSVYFPSFMFGGFRQMTGNPWLSAHI